VTTSTTNEKSVDEMDKPPGEFPNPDLTFAYASLAPLVTEALTFLRCNRRTECEETLLQARKIIETATAYQILFMGKTPW
tara:strand:- start:1478 stop:1717 length:240 start_codon:yes stop_codon:yes gene_type:complete